MNRWLMQLHPDDGAHAMRHTVESLGSGLIGLDFKKEQGDMRQLDLAKVEPSERGFIRLLDTMKPQDVVLVVVHGWPFAVVEVEGDYQYDADPKRAWGVWFSHARKINRDRSVYIADKATNAHEWEPCIATSTMVQLRDPDGVHYRIIEKFRAR